MPGGKYSRDKGVRGERDIVHRLVPSAKRVGHSYIATPVDVESGFAVYQIKNRTAGGSEAAKELARLKQASSKDCFFVFKVKDKWYCVEELEQHVGDHY